MVEPPGVRATWHGHATVELQLDGARVLTDPLLRPRLAHLRRHAPPVALAPGRIDLVLISHAHHDHLDLRSLRRLARDVTVIAPVGTRALLAGVGFRNVEEVTAGDERDVAGLHVTVVEARHRAGRVLRDVPAEPVGYLVRSSRALVYFAGDTALFPAMAELPAPDLALLPIWGWGRSLGPGHLDPGQAAEAAARLRARHALPVHWGTLVRRGVQVRAPNHLWLPAVRFAAELARRSPATTLHLVPPGGTVEI